jgi:hypothetical protein
MSSLNALTQESNRNLKISLTYQAELARIQDERYFTIFWGNFTICGYWFEIAVEMNIITCYHEWRQTLDGKIKEECSW